MADAKKVKAIYTIMENEIEELKERLEFDMAGGGWQYETKPTAKLKAKNDKIVGGEGGAKINFQWKQ